MQIKPCPFCGGEAEVDGDYEIYYVICTNCGARTATIDDNMADKPMMEVVKLWNRRELAVLAAESIRRDNVLTGLEADVKAMQQEWQEAHDELKRMRAQVTHEGFDDLATMIAKYKTVMLAANETSIEQDDEIEKLKADLKKLSDCENCKHEITDDRCEESDYTCNTCTQDCVCKDCVECSNWEWRGLDNGTV
ncbi:MAG TPA: Lar family restriction alleviation protein [Anaerolineaceae bacterium]|nr:Lar family restriction alleviation protein [Anaerolineaceae bacterium]